jgi:hypothetical protein
LKAWIVPVWIKGADSLVCYVAGFADPNEATEEVRRLINLEGEEARDPISISGETARELGVRAGTVRML